MKQTTKRLIFYRLKKARNKIRSYIYSRKKCIGQDAILRTLGDSETKELCITIAFNTPWTIELLIECWREHCAETTLLVADNSNKSDQSKLIHAICKIHGIPYIKLPRTSVRHPSRSHGLALNWVWHNIICKQTKIKKVGFLDHDCYPIAKCVPNQLNRRSVFGMRQDSWIEGSKAFNLWAGYMFFASEINKSLSDYNVDFLPDILHGLDTGGGNWNSLYSKLPKDALEFAEVELVRPGDLIKGYTVQNNFKFQLLDGKFIHASGVSIPRPKATHDPNRIDTFCNLIRELLDNSKR